MSEETIFITAYSSGKVYGVFRGYTQAAKFFFPKKGRQKATPLIAYSLKHKTRLETESGVFAFRLSKPEHIVLLEFKDFVLV